MIIVIIVIVIATPTTKTTTTSKLKQLSAAAAEALALLRWFEFRRCELCSCAIITLPETTAAAAAMAARRQTSARRGNHSSLARCKSCARICAMSANTHTHTRTQRLLSARSKSYQRMQISTTRTRLESRAPQAQLSAFSSQLLAAATATDFALVPSATLFVCLSVCPCDRLSRVCPFVRPSVRLSAS